jgi:hypothetical protein
MSNKGAKILAIFLVSTMVLSSIAFFASTQDNRTSQETPSEKPVVDFLDVGGELINQPFNSLKDALNITPSGVTRAEYVNLQAASGTPMEPFLLGQLRSEGLPVEELNRLYGANTTHMYFAYLENNSFLLMARFNPQIVTFNFITVPYRNYNMLLREDTGAINVMGNPTIYGPQPAVADALDLIDRVSNHTAYKDYEALMKIAPQAEYQLITNNITFADQFYLGLTTGENNTYRRTTIYLNPEESLVQKINTLKQNSTQRGFTEYNVTTTGDLMTVNIESTLINVVREEYQ